MRYFFWLLALPFTMAHAQVANTDSLLEIVKQNNQDLNECHALNTLATNYSRTDMVKARNYLYTSIVISKKLNELLSLSDAYSTMVAVQQNTGHADSASVYLQELKALADLSPGPGVKENYHGAAGLFYKRQGNYKAALPFMLASVQDAIDADREKHSPAGMTSIAGQYLNAGNTYIKLGDYKNALSCHLKSLHNFEEVNNQRGMSFCYQSIASDFLNLNQYAAATDYTHRSMALKTELNDKRGLATSYAELGEIDMRQKNYDQSLVNYSKALKSFHDMKLTIDEAQANIEMGKIYGMKKEPESAAVFFQNARMLAQSLKDSSLLSAVESESVALETDMNKQRAAETKLVSSLRRSVETGNKTMELQNDQYLADHFASVHQYDKALAYSNKAHQITDSIQSSDLILQMNRMEKQFNLDKKEKEIELLKKNRLLDQANFQQQRNIQIAGLVFFSLLMVIGFLMINRYRILNKAKRVIEMERMRNTIARDLHDDIGSMLTSINILSTVMIGQSAHDIPLATNLKKIKDRSATIMENMGDIVWAINPANDNMEKMVNRMKNFAAEILEPAEIDYSFIEEGKLSELGLDLRQRKDIYLIFKESINNAAKYSRCKNLTVELGQYPQKFHLAVMDNGQGFDVAKLSSGNGLANMKERANSLNAELRIESVINKGTTIRLDVPVNNG